MKRERNTFFSNYTAQNTSYIPNVPQMPNMNFNTGIPTSQPFYNSNNESGYFQGTDIANYNEFDNRFTKLERIVNRLDSRVSKLESTTNLDNTPITNNTYSNMYML